MQIDRNVPIPIYYQLKQILLQEIASQKYKQGECIPTEQELMAWYGVSRMTVRQAISELASEGFLTRRKGMGTYVTERKAKINIVLDVGRVGREATKKLERKNLNFYRDVADARIAEILRIAPGSPVYVLERLFYLQEGILRNFSKNTVPCAYFPNMENDLDKVAKGLHRYFDSQGHAVTNIHQKIEASRADRETAKRLQLRTGSLILLVTNTGFTADGTLVEHTVDAFSAPSISIWGTRVPTTS